MIHVSVSARFKKPYKASFNTPTCSINVWWQNIFILPAQRDLEILKWGQEGAKARGEEKWMV